jgi:FAD binding domain
MATVVVAGRLREALRGPVLAPRDIGYDEARIVYNAMIDKRPALIARCADVADVITAVNYGREQGLELAVRGGGHNGAGLALVDSGLVIDLSLMRGVRVDPDERTARSQAARSSATSTTPRTPSGWPRLPGSCPRPASADSRSAAGTAT